MPDKIDYDALARGFLDLWQEETGKMAQSPEMRAFAEQWMALFMPFAANAPPSGSPGTQAADGQQDPAAQGGEMPHGDGFTPAYRPGGSGRAQRVKGTGEAADDGDGGNSPGISGAGSNGKHAKIRAAPAAPAPDDRNAELEQLPARIRELEERLAGLESRLREHPPGAGAPRHGQRRNAPLRNGHRERRR